MTSATLAVDLAAVVRAIEALMSPLDWGSQHAWLAESLARVRQARGAAGSSGTVVTAELEGLLRLDGDEPGWLAAALDSGDTRAGTALPRLSSLADDCLPVVSMRSALAAGLAILQRLHLWRSTLGQVCDDVNTGMAIFRCDGLRAVVRNARWDELIDEEPERDRLLSLVSCQAGHTAAAVGSVREDYAELELCGGSYRLIARRAAAGTLLSDAGVLVLMDRVGPELPTTRELRVSFGLRGREPQIALLAAEGLSNAAIAEQLRLSAHTVRHYLERVLTRMGLHSRKALALHLMAGEREKPAVDPGDRALH
jgi:DNA-binding CsgD family transcriptional regulator